jgi:molybdenum cofactor cytidylyltransferase
MSAAPERIAAIVLAAGMSTRMGQPKMLLPWGEQTVIQTVVDALVAGSVRNVIVVTGAVHDQIVGLLENLPVRIVFNPLYSDGEMLHSLQIGLSEMSPDIQAVLIVLGDQPQILSATVANLMREFYRSNASLVIPSYNMRRGHPWLIRRKLWAELEDLHPPFTMRDFLQKHAGDIHYLNQDTPTILADIDTPEDYQNSRPAGPDQA